MSPDLKRDRPYEQFYNQISSLTQTALTGSERYRNTARSSLIAGIRQDLTYDSVIFTVEQIQREIIREGKPKVVQTASALLLDVINEGAHPKDQSGPIFINLDDQRVKKSIEAILRQHQVLERNPYISNRLPNIYYSLTERTLPYAKSAAENGISKLQVMKNPDGENPTNIQEAAIAHNDWVIEMAKLLDSEEIFLGKSEGRDAFIDLLRTEPEAKRIMGMERMLEAKYGGIALIDIENMQAPLSKDNFERILEYVTGALSPTDAHQLARETQQDRIIKLFFIPTVFHKDFEPVTLRNSNLLANINYWQESLINYLIVGGDSELDEKVKKLLGATPDKGVFLLLQSLAAWAIRPHILDPDYRVGNYPETVGKHLLLSLAFQNLAASIEEQPTFIQGDVIGNNFLRDTLYLRVQTRLAELGYGDRFKEVIDETTEFYTKERLRQLHVTEIKNAFEFMCGPDFLAKLRKHMSELESITKRVWESLFEQGMHFLPMQQGINAIEFSGNSVPETIGFKTLRLHLANAPQQWKVGIEFTLKAGGQTIIGMLNQDGILQLNDPIQEQIPELYAVLNLIAVLTFHDLAIQNKNKGDQKKQIKQFPDKKDAVQISDNEGEHEETDNLAFQIYRSYRELLPRTQTDTQLVKDVYRSTGFTPRRVELHRRWLPGHEEYTTAVNLYYEAKENNASELTMTWITQELEQARRKARKASPEKVKNMPARFQLEHVTDPITREVRYLRTWVVEHSSPKPTDEELKSPIILYERYYHRVSALAFLDQMKPWFIGE